jgi:hypothetical protein
MDNLGSLPGVTDDSSDDNTRSDRDLVGALSKMTMRHKSRSFDLIKMAISNLQMAAQVDSRVAPICDKAIAALSGPMSGERNTTSIDRDSGGGAVSSIPIRRA